MVYVHKLETEQSICIKRSSYVRTTRVNHCNQQTLVSIYVHTYVLHSVPSSRTLYQQVLIVSTYICMYVRTTDKKPSFGVPFKVLIKQVGLYINAYIRTLSIINMCTVCTYVCTQSGKLTQAGLPNYPFLVWTSSLASRTDLHRRGSQTC